MVNSLLPDALLSPLHQAIALLCLVLALHFASSGTRRPWPMRLLALTYGVYALQSLTLVAQLAHWSLPESVAPLRLLGAMLLAPLLWWLLQLLRRPDGRFRWGDSLHLTPALLTMLLLASHSPLRQWLDLWLLASYAGYLVAVAYGLWAPNRQLDWQNDDQQLAKRYVQIQAGLLLLNLAIECAVVLSIQQGETAAASMWLVPAALLFLLAHVLMVLLALQRSRGLAWLYERRDLPQTAPSNSALASEALTDKQQTSASSMTSDASPKANSASPTDPNSQSAALAGTVDDTDGATAADTGADLRLHQVFSRWLTLLEEQRLYQLEFGITLAQAARKLQVPARLLSNAVNHCYGASFSVLLNDKRISYACQLLLQQPTLSVTDVMLQAGFASKSNFHKEFLRVTGTTPSHFRDAQLPKNLL